MSEHKLKGPERALLLFAGFSVIAAGWLLLGFVLSRRRSEGLSIAPMLPPGGGFSEAPPEPTPAAAGVFNRGYERVGRIGSRSFSIAAQPVTIVDTAMPGSRRFVTISSDQPVRVSSGTASPTNGMYLAPNTPFTWPRPLEPGDFLRAVRAGGVTANLSVQIMTEMRR